MQSKMSKHLAVTIISLILFASLSAIPAFAAHTTPGTIYVDPNSSCPGFGTKAEPFCNLELAISHSTPGDGIMNDPAVWRQETVGTTMVEPEVSDIPEEVKEEVEEESEPITMEAGQEEEKVQVEQEEKMHTEEIEQQSDGGCLIATAAFGSELAPQVQMLREIRDNSVLNTASGTAFMMAFNQFYYSFSPTIADFERENVVFKETVKVAITPLLTSLSILNYVDIDSEEEMLGYGIGVILLNLGMYFVAPALIIIKLKNKI